MATEPVVLDAERRQIRLLTFEFNERKEIQGRFKVVSLNQPPRYTALSYLWGSEPPDRVIWIDSRPFLVRPGLFAYIELATEGTIGQGIFIDAICINQDNAAEKTSQIALMGSLYTLAFEVTVWFGDGSPWLPSLVQQYPAIVDPVVLRSCLLKGSTEDLTAQDVGKIGMTVWYYLVENVYWSRLWTAQEFVVSNELVFRIGRLKLNVRSWMAVLETLMSRDEATRMRQSERSMKFVAGRIAHADSGQLHKGSLFQPILRFAEQECFVPRDRLFGLLGLCKSGIVADYSAPMIKLYIKTLSEGLQDLRSIYRDADLRHNLQVFTASLLRSLGMRLEHPAVILVTLLVFDPKTEATHDNIKQLFAYTGDLWHHPQLKELLQCREVLEFVCRLQTRAAFRTFCRGLRENGRVIGPEGESRTFVEWVEYVDQVLGQLTYCQKGSDDRAYEDEPLTAHPRWRELF
ncbi:hypothetical protein LTR15_007089 [Elasticomyces elasticus]|nr:hypothetical protein LTR15_007089 [Elasticomyces elasticus]